MKQMKNRKSNNGITLIALVITIIVLLILAAVSIAMLTGENGILSKASTAKEKHLIAQYEEELNLCIMEMQTDELGTLTMEKLIEKLPQYIQASQPGEQCEWDKEQIAEEPTGTYKGYEFKVDKNKKAQITGKATGIMISCSVEPSEYTNKNVKATIKIICNEGIQSIKQIEPKEEPIPASGTEKTIVKENIGENTTFKYEVIDSKGNKDTKVAQVTNIDKEAPADFTITAENTEQGLKITGTTTDEDSGIDRYEYYAKESTESEYKKYDSNPITGLSSGTYDIKVIAYDKAQNSKTSELKKFEVIKPTKRTNISAQDIKENPEGYYGLKVTNYESQNGQNDWRIFYSDGTHIFLITGDYVDLSVANRLNSNTGMTKVGTKYRANWSSAPSSLQTVEDIVKTRFMATGYTLNSSYENSKCVSTMLNAGNWESYKDNNGMAEYATGGSTIEMWIASWNELCEKKYKRPSEKLYCNKTSGTGYYIGTSSKPSTDHVNANEMTRKEGYNNTLYYPHHETVLDGDKKCVAYWLASPNDCYYKDYVFLVMSYGDVMGYPYDAFGETGMALRPIVSLNSEITVNATDAE